MIGCVFFEWRSALGIWRVALASGESNAAPKRSEARNSPAVRERPKNNVLVWGCFVVLFEGDGCGFLFFYYLNGAVYFANEGC
jgi:hypothetical protein